MDKSPSNRSAAFRCRRILEGRKLRFKGWGSNPRVRIVRQRGSRGGSFLWQGELPADHQHRRMEGTVSLLDGLHTTKGAQDGD